MRTILVANPKGGSGKTTLATNVAGWLAGKRQRVVLADHDPQRSATEWLARRPPLFPPIIGLPPGAKKSELRGYDPQYVVVDSPAGLHGDDLADAVRDADVMLVPVSPSAFDMAATQRISSPRSPTTKPVRKGDLAVGLVAMRVDARTVSAGELDVFLAAIGIRWSRTCATRRCTSTARATARRCSTCRARAPSRTGSSGGR